MKDGVGLPGGFDPQIVLDAGGETLEVLLDALTQCLHDMAPGQLLQLISQHPEAHIHVPRWCEAAGHAVLHVLREGESLCLWIKKADSFEA